MTAEQSTPSTELDVERRIDRLRRRWEQLNRGPVTDCAHARGETEFVQINANGSRFLYTGCVECRTPLATGKWISQNGRDLTGIPVGDDRRTQNPPCQVCGDMGTELHHWAPRQLFGTEESNHWPTAWLCVPCHAEWHKRINDRR